MSDRDQLRRNRPAAARPATDEPRSRPRASRLELKRRIASRSWSWPSGVWLLVKASEDWRAFAIVTLNGITLAALFFVVASGFTLIFGLMRVVNMAHGALYLLGGYLALEMQDAWFKEDTGLGLSLSGTGRADYSLFGWVVPLLLATR